LVKLKFLASLKEYAPAPDSAGCFTIEYRPGMTVGDALGKTDISKTSIKFSVLVNNVRKTPEDVLQDGDVVTVMPLLAGG